MIRMFSDRNYNVVLAHLNGLIASGKDLQIINIFPSGAKLIAFYQVKNEFKNEDEIKEEKKKTQLK